ncbi:MAG: hypothetical protein A3J75_08380 [Acidobacteria bacterium RBG_16_68_9]|nr:MAG: hypothetical protein A3J75_08380 [Acidobacteria bacterium RBG_16_68_9]
MVAPRNAHQTRHAMASLYTHLCRCGASLSETERWRIAAAIHEESQRHGYNPFFVLAMVQVESACSPRAIGPRGSVGLIQLQPRVARELARDADIPWNGTRTLTLPRINVRLGVQYLAELEKRFRDPWVAVAAYNLGPGRVARMSRQRAQKAHYVRKVLDRYEQLLAENARESPVGKLRRRVDRL